MREVEVEALVEREGGRTTVQRNIDLRARVAECVVLEPRDDFLLVADSYRALWAREVRIVCTRLWRNF